jgi:hypothetical protein
VKLAALPYWSAADQAELDLLTAELVKAAMIHRERCSCKAALPWCRSLRDALEAVVEWRDLRILQSWAAYERARQDLNDWEAA